MLGAVAAAGGLRVGRAVGDGIHAADIRVRKPPRIREEFHPGEHQLSEHGFVSEAGRHFPVVRRDALHDLRHVEIPLAEGVPRGDHGELVEVMPFGNLEEAHLLLGFDKPVASTVVDRLFPAVRTSGQVLQRGDGSASLPVPGPFHPKAVLDEIGEMGDQSLLVIPLHIGRRKVGPFDLHALLPMAGKLVNDQIEHSVHLRLLPFHFCRRFKAPSLKNLTASDRLSLRLPQMSSPPQWRSASRAPIAGSPEPSRSRRPDRRDP